MGLVEVLLKDRPSATVVAGVVVGAATGAVAAADVVAAVDTVAAAVFEVVAGGAPVIVAAAAAAFAFVPAAGPVAVDGVGVGVVVVVVIVIVLMAPLLKQSEGDPTLGPKDCLDHGATQKRKAEAMKSGKLDSSFAGIGLRSSSLHLIFLMQCR